MSKEAPYSRIIEVWCWPRIILDEKILNYGHVELKADKFYTFLPDKDMTILVNPDRTPEKDDAFYGCYAGLIRITDDAELLSSYDDVYRRLIRIFSRKGKDFDVKIIVGGIPVSESQYSNLLTYLQDQKGRQKKREEFFAMNETEYFYRSEGQSKNCVNFAFDALRRVNIFDPNDDLGGDGFWPEEFVDLLVKKHDSGNLAYLKTGTFSPAKFDV